MVGAQKRILERCWCAGAATAVKQNERSVEGTRVFRARGCGTVLMRFFSRTLARSIVFLSVVSDVQFIFPAFVFRAHSCCNALNATSSWLRTLQGSKIEPAPPDPALPPDPAPLLFEAPPRSSWGHPKIVFPYPATIFIRGILVVFSKAGTGCRVKERSQPRPQPKQSFPLRRR